MITDSIKNAPSYFNISPRITAALQFLARPDLAGLPLGKHVIDTDRIFALVQEYPPKPQDQCYWEAHRKYIDVQFIQSGIEAMGWSPIERMTVSKEYNPDKDLLVLQGQGQLIQVPAGTFIIFLPHDAHMPCVAVAGQPQPVRKIVVKVAVG